MNSVGKLVAILGLDASEYTRGLTKAEKDAQRFAKNTRQAILDVGAALGGLQIGQQFIQATKDIIAEAAALNDLSDATGSSVEALSRLNNQAKIAGLDFNTLQALTLKLSQGMSGIDDESSKAGRALRLLGVTTKDPAEAMQQVAVKLNTYADGIGKVSIATALFQKQGPAFLATLKDIAELQDVGATVTKKQAQEAEALEKAYRRLGVEATGFKNVILSDVVPALITLIQTMTDAVRAAGTFGQGLEATFSLLARSGSTADQLAKVNTEIENVKKSLAKGFGPFKGLSELNDFIKGEQLNDLINQRAVLEKRLQREAGASAPPGPPKPPAPFIADDSSSKTAKRILDGQLKDLDNFIKAERDTLNDRERFLQGYYNDDLLGVREFFSGRRAALEEAVQNELGALDKQAALLRASASKGKPEDRIEAETKLADVLSKRARLEQDTVTKGTELFLEEGRAVKKLQDSVEQASIALAAMRGDSVTAAAASFDFANREILKQIAFLKNSASPEDQRLGEIGEKAFADTRALVVLREQLNVASQKYGLTLDKLGIAQSDVDVKEQANSITAIAAINEKARITAAYVEILKAELSAVEALAAASGRREDVVRAQQLRAQLDQLAVGYSLVAREAKALQAVQEQVFDIGANALADFIAGTVSARDALKALLADLQRFLTNQALMGIKNSIFGGPSTGTDIFSLLAKQFTGGAVDKVADAGGAAALTTSATALTAAGTELVVAGTGLSLAGVEATAAATLLITAATALTTSAAALSAAAVALGAKSTAEGVSSIFQGLAQGGGLARGTDFARGGMTLVGERGPELVDLPAGARVTPNHKIGRMAGALTINQVVNVMPGATTASSKQAAGRARDAIIRAIREK